MKPFFYSILFALLLPLGAAYSQQQRVFVACTGLIFGEPHNILVSVDLSNCTSHYIDTLPVGVFTIASTPNGRLWALQSDNFGHLYSVDTATGQITYVDSFDTHGDYVQSMGALNDSVLLTQCWDGLYGVTTTNVHSFRIGTVGSAREGDMTWLGQDLYIIGFGGSEGGGGGDPDSMILTKVTFNNGSYPPIASAAPVSNTPSVPYCSALATYILPNGDTALIGFADSSAYIINPADGSYTLYCSILPDSFGHSDDAASFSYPTVPIILDTTNPDGVVSPPNSGLMVNIYPNPAKDKLYINCPYVQAELALTDVAGKIILREVLKNGVSEINMTSFAPGLYLASIRIEGNIMYRQKIIKE